MQIIGTEYTFETHDLAAITKGNANEKPALILCYKQGLILPIQVEDKNDLDRQYAEAVQYWKENEKYT